MSVTFEPDRVPDALGLAQDAVRAGLISQGVLDHLNSLQPQVPNSIKLRYLLNQLRKRVSGDEQLFFKMFEVLIAFQSTCANTANDTPLTTDHIADLAELLVPYASEWRSIGTALKFKPQDLNNIEACRSLKDRMLKLIDDWILKKHEHTLPPTAKNIESILKSQLVGLGEVACKLRANIAYYGQHSMQNQALPYFVGRIIITKDYEEFVSSTHIQTPNIKAEENKSVLLEVQVEMPYHDCIGIKYQWLRNGSEILEDRNHTGVTTPVLCVTNAGIGMDGSKYSCQIAAEFSEEEEDDGDSRVIICEMKSVTLWVSCPLDQYNSGLASLYLAQPEVPEDTWPPVNSTKHINLALIKQDTAFNYSAKYAHFTIQRDMDDILQDKQKIEYVEILQDVKSSFVLFIEGRPGSGKTTFVHKLTRDWAAAPSGALRLVLLVSLRVLNDLDKPSLDLSDILDLFEDLKVPKELLEKRHGNSVCFVFDGLDEYSPSNGKDSIVYKIINKKYLNQSSVIVASHPAATARLRSRADRVIEVLGFPNKQVFEYFDNYGFSVSSKSEDLKAFLQVHPNILHMCYLPYSRCYGSIPFRGHWKSA